MDSAALKVVANEGLYASLRVSGDSSMVRAPDS